MKISYSPKFNWGPISRPVIKQSYRLWESDIAPWRLVTYRTAPIAATLDVVGRSLRHKFPFSSVDHKINLARGGRLTGGCCDIPIYPEATAAIVSILHLQEVQGVGLTDLYPEDHWKSIRSSGWTPLAHQADWTTGGTKLVLTDLNTRIFTA